MQVRRHKSEQTTSVIVGFKAIWISFNGQIIWTKNPMISKVEYTLALAVWGNSTKQVIFEAICGNSTEQVISEQRI
ncbi:hypothetical protein F8M41_002604 [Gigaspora margarita]|uniref:Uncharacterized protein n=1 Tax=Gigaspora margarita TaxID=4874 RepID=A0A8H3XDE2_GIGMA|nr:hypothetical protein F8M41_002604 [Gigaspora margarita]